MNLTTDPWIPIVWTDGNPGTVSLREAFERGHEIQDLAVRPHERIALMRLLNCIAQAALDGPADDGDWKTCAPRIAQAALDYLERCQPAFELSGDNQRFLQVSGLEKRASKKGEDEERGSVSKLDVALATGNNTTLFDNAGGATRSSTGAQMALNLLSFQCFSPGGRIGVALWNSKETAGKGSSEHAPCMAGGMLHALVRGEDLLESIHLNLLNKHLIELALGPQKWGQPVWESMPNSPRDAANVANATNTYLGRLVPLSRAVRLEPDDRSVLLANALSYPVYPEAREPTATVVVRTKKGQPERGVLRASLDKAAWRELHSLTVKAISQVSNGGPLALQNVSDDEPFDLWVGGFVADQAKLVDTLESVFHVPATMLHDPNQRTYEAGVKHAEDVEFRLRRAVSVYHKELGDNLDRAEMRERRQQVQSKAAFQFWTDVERHVSDLLAVADDLAMLGLDNSWRKTAWGQSVRRAAHAAYERACSHETSRQIRAYALGLKTLLPAPTGQAEVETEKEAEV